MNPNYDLPSARVQQIYLGRLSQRVRLLRRLYVERRWKELRAEAGQLKLSALHHRVPVLVRTAEEVELAIPRSALNTADAVTEATAPVERLLGLMDHLLVVGTRNVEELQ